MIGDTITWERLDWGALDRLRDRFLAPNTPEHISNYWTTTSDLANYDFTFAQRIGWKWDSVLAGLRQRGWRPPPGPVLDWGCGSGIAGRRVLGFMGPKRATALRLFDQSHLAMQFAAAAARKQFPEIPIETRGRADLEGLETCSTLVISHVLNELDEAAGRLLRQTIDRAEAVLWVEPGTFADSRALIAVRESLQDFAMIAPCPHQGRCGLLAAGNERHWCHHFAPAPAGIMADSNWVRFAQRAGIDLRSLPYSYLILEKKKGMPRPLESSQTTKDKPWTTTQVLGRPRVYKGFAKLLCCQETGVRELELQKRVNPAVFKEFKEGQGRSLWQVKLDEARIVELETPATG